MSSPPNPPAVVLDCMVFLQALANEESAAARVLDLLDRSEITLYVSEQTLRELRAVVERSEVRKSLPGINDLRVETLFRRLDKKAVRIKPVPKTFEYERDPADEPYINLAIAARADFLVTRDRDLLDLMTGYDRESKDLRQRFRFLTIIEPEELLQKLEP